MRPGGESGEILFAARATINGDRECRVTHDFPRRLFPTEFFPRNFADAAARRARRRGNALFSRQTPVYDNAATRIRNHPGLRHNRHFGE